MRSFKGRMSVKAKVVRGETRFGFCGETEEGRAFECFENDPSIDETFQKRFSIKAKQRFTSLQADPILALCLAREAPERLAELGWSSDDRGGIRVASLGSLDRFTKYSTAYTDKKREEQLQRTLRNKLEDKGRTGLILFETTHDGRERWAYLHVDPNVRIGMAPDVINELVSRFRGELKKAAARSAARESATAERIEQLTGQVMKLIVRILEGMGPASSSGQQDIVARLVGRADRWWPVLLEIFRSPDGQVTAAKIGARLLWGRTPPSQDQILDFLQRVAPEVAPAFAPIAKCVTDARAETVRELCLQALRAHSAAPKPDVVERIAVAGFVDLRGWLLDAIDAERLLSSVQPATSTAPDGGPRREGEAGRES